MAYWDYFWGHLKGLSLGSIPPFLAKNQRVKRRRSLGLLGEFRGSLKWGYKGSFKGLYKGTIRVWGFWV